MRAAGGSHVSQLAPDGPREGPRDGHGLPTTRYGPVGGVGAVQPGVNMQYPGRSWTRSVKVPQSTAGVPVQVGTGGVQVQPFWDWQYRGSSGWSVAIFAQGVGVPWQTP